MWLSKLLKWIFSIFLVIFLFSLIMGALLGQPIGLAYVETGSMEPTIGTGDGYVAVPTAVAGPIEQGDIIVFDAVNINDGKLVTHRVVRKTEQGYITQGDANPVTDQDGAEPPVQKSQIKAKVLTIGGQVIVIPKLGTVVITISGIVEWIQRNLAIVLGTRAVLGTQGIAYLLGGFGVITYLLSSAFERSTGRNRARQTKRKTGVLTPKTIIASMTLILIILLTASMILPAGTHQFQFVSSETDAAGTSVIKLGTSESLTFKVPSNGPLPVVTVFESGDGASVNHSFLYVSGGTTKSIDVRLKAPDQTGTYVRTVNEYRYLAFLPTSVILFLYGIHQWLPIIVINILMSLLFVIVALLLIGFDPIRINRRQENVPLRVRLRRWLK